MTWLLASAYVVAGWLLAAAVRTRTDRQVLVNAGAGPERRPALRPWRADRRTLALVGLTIGGSVALVDPITALLAGPTLGLVGYRLPAFLRARQDRIRRTEMSAAVPDLLDVVAVAVTAGLSPRLALDRATGFVAGPLGRELSAMRHDVALGGTWRSGLRDGARRLAMPELQRLALILQRSERLGAPVADRLRALAREVRAERRTGREERARRAPVAMLFPLVFLILPAFVLAAMVPAVLVAVRGVP